MGNGPIQDEMMEEGSARRDNEAPAAATSPGPPDTDSEAQDTDLIENRISELQRDLTSERDKMLRLAAEFDNYRKRMMRERLEAEGRGKAELVKEILEPMDDIARFAHVDPAVTDSSTLVEGVAMVERKLEKTMKAAGLEVVNPVGEAFDPTKHEAVGTEPAGHLHFVQVSCHRSAPLRFGLWLKYIIAHLFLIHKAHIGSCSVRQYGSSLLHVYRIAPVGRNTIDFIGNRELEGRSLSKPSQWGNRGDSAATIAPPKRDSWGPCGPQTPTGVISYKA